MGGDVKVVPLKRKFPSKAESALQLGGACSFAQAHEADTRSIGTPGAEVMLRFHAAASRCLRFKVHYALEHRAAVCTWTPTSLIDW